ncbi:MAG: DNA mismatch repair endonuclease MutL [Armatimonadetes bacterium]|nr:DNA mismatch repair endonuclease MutL [Armatimonadota bacterium]
MPNRVTVLEPDIANKIAAGEVIERPASVVKELVENAIDAGASQIEVHVEEGGRRRLEVRDDGCGMSPQDAVIAFQRHATSKIRSLEDLFHITTLGFRGEALPSIASIAQVELTSREQDSPVGLQLQIEGGVVTELTEVGCPVGTTFVVKNIFFNTPARLKFLKSEMTEMGHVTDLMSRFALSHHALSFLLTHNDQEVVRHAATPDLFASIVDVYGREVAREMVPVEYESPSLSIKGFVSKPTTTRASRNRQSFYVNGRYVRSRSLTHAIQQGYHGLLHGERFPFVVILLNLDPELVDANVHPTKIEVRFSHEGEIHNTVMKSVRQALLGAQLDRTLPTTQPAPATSPPQPSQLNLATGPPAALSPGHPYTGAPLGLTESAPSLSRPFLETSSSTSALSPSPAPQTLRLRPLSQIRNTYILADSEEGLFIVNQHRAHERILCDQALAKVRRAPVEEQRLVIPLTVDLSHREALAVQENVDMIRALGFDVEPFGGDSFVVRSIPVLIAKQNYEQAFRDVVDELAHSSTLKHLDNKREALLTMMACRSAIKAGDFLREEEIHRLIQDLQHVENPYLCPHGQPIIISISHHELDKRFERV